MAVPFLASHARKEMAKPLSAAAGVGQILQDGFEFELSSFAAMLPQHQNHCLHQAVPSRLKFSSFQH